MSTKLFYSLGNKVVSSIKSSITKSACVSSSSCAKSKLHPIAVNPLSLAAYISDRRSPTTAAFLYHTSLK